jgi:hypothetical protein
MIFASLYRENPMYIFINIHLNEYLNFIFMFLDYNYI